MIRDEGKKIIGDAINVFIPYLSTIEKIKFGKYSGFNSINGIANSNTPALIIHRADDGMVSYYNNYPALYS